MVIFIRDISTMKIRAKTDNLKSMRGYRKRVIKVTTKQNIYLTLCFKLINIRLLKGNFVVIKE